MKDASSKPLKNKRRGVVGVEAINRQLLAEFRNSDQIRQLTFYA
jgi:hypothetical protein